MSRTFGEDLRAGLRKGLRDTLIWPPLPTAITWIRFQATGLLITLGVAVAHPEFPRAALLYLAVAGAVLIAAALGLARRKRWAWLLALAVEIPATLAFAFFFWLGLHPPADRIPVLGFHPEPAPVDVIVVLLLSSMAFGPVLYGLLHPATRAAVVGGRVRQR